MLTDEDFWAYMPKHLYICRPTGELWPAPSVNARLGEGASKRLDRERAVEQMTWCPGQPEIIENRLVIDGDSSRTGLRTYNLYRPPVIEEGDPDEAIIGSTSSRPSRGEADHIDEFFAHRAHGQMKRSITPCLRRPPGIGKERCSPGEVRGRGLEL